MKKNIKSYLVFTSVYYRMVMYGLMPVAMVGFSVWLGNTVGEAALLAMVPLLAFVEIFSDSWLFGGIQARDSEKMDFLKTSGRGIQTLKHALILDLVRKFLSCLVILSAGRLAMKTYDKNVIFGDILFQSSYDGPEGLGRNLEVLLGLVLIAYSFSVLGTFLSRYGSMIWINFVTGYIVMILAVVCIVLMILLRVIWLFDFAFFAFGAGSSVLAVRAAVKKNEGGYYDK